MTREACTSPLLSIWTSLRARMLGLGLFAASALSMWQLDQPRDRPAKTLDCREAVTLDGLLLCGAEDWAMLGVVRPAATPMRVGDAYRTRGGDVIRVGRMQPADIGALALPVDVNAASAAELDTLPGIGPVLADRVVEARPFTAVGELDDVRGIGPVKLLGLRARARTRPTVTAGLSGDRP